MDLNLDLDLEEMTVRKEKPRTGSATSARAVNNTGVLGLGFITTKKRNKKTREATKSGAREAKGQAGRHRLAEAQVIAHASMTQD
jgi:hypothetical protein